MAIVTFILVLGLLIFVHEFGHFYFAKRAGVGVEKFSIGFGPKIVAFRRGETEYQLALIPLGGYVKMVGDNPDEAKTGSAKEFLSRPVRDRLPIVLAGPFVNLVVAFLIMPVVYMIGVEIPAFVTQPPVIGYVTPGSPAEKAGLRPGDEIQAIDGRPTPTWEAVLGATLTEPNQTVQVAFVRGGSKLAVRVQLAADESGAAFFGVQPPAAPVIGKVNPGSPAEAAGLQSGDLVLRIDGQPVIHWVQMAEAIQNAGTKPIGLEYERRGQRAVAMVTPARDEASGRAIIGIQRQEELVTQRFGVVAALGEGFKRIWGMLTQTFDILGKLLTGQLSIRTLGGPIRIAQATSAAAESGLADVLSLMAFLSLQLGILNLLPFPVLDGGHVLFMAIEVIRRRPLSRRVLEISNQVGFVLLLLLMIVVTKNDIMHAWGSNLRRLFEGVRQLF